MSNRTPRQSPLEQLEARQLMAANVRSVDGSGNNLAHTDWGSVGQTYLRLAAAAYADGKSAAAGATRPSARAISNTIVAQGDVDILSTKHLAAFAYVWGQFIDHDLDLTNTGDESMPISVPTGDAYFDPTGTGTQTIDFDRSNAAAGTGVTNTRQQVNSITAYIDGSMIYGSDAVTAASLRTFTGGQLKSDAGLLPDLTGSGFFDAGDVRVDENIELIAIQTLFMREHNRQATAIAAKNATWTDEQVFQQARKMVVAEIQSITYNEFLPALLGTNSLRPYSGYKPNVNAEVSTEFATAAYRLGHSMLADDVEFMNDDGTASRDEISLSQAFFNPSIVRDTGIDPILKYMATSNSEQIDTKLVDSVRNFLFGNPGEGGFDLASLNIQRGRDHGLADYNTTRAAVGLPRVTRFDQITSDVAVQQQLKSLYGTVDNIDLWVGGLAEDHLGDSAVGPTFGRIIADQFTRTRDGDRFWYESYLNRDELQQVRSTSLANIVKANSGLSNLQSNVLVFDVEVTGRVFNDLNINGRADPRELGLGARTVSLYAEDGTLVDTATTKADGSYTFGFVQVGQYKVQAAAVAGWHATTASTTVSVTRGEQFAGVNFGLTRITTFPSLPPVAMPTLPAHPRMVADILI